MLSTLTAFARRRNRLTTHFSERIPVVTDRVAQSVQRLAMGWTVRGTNPGGGEIFRTCPDPPWGPPSLLYNEYRVFPGGKEWLGRDTDPSPPSSAVVKKEQSYTSTPPMGRTACTESQCLYKGALFIPVFKRRISLYVYVGSIRLKTVNTVQTLTKTKHLTDDKALFWSDDAPCRRNCNSQDKLGSLVSCLSG